jgi:hypothetical protein
LAGLHSRLRSTRAPADYRRFDATARIRIVPDSVAQPAQKRNHICPYVILTQELEWLIRRRIAFMREGIDALLPCCHGVLDEPPRRQFDAYA